MRKPFLGSLILGLFALSAAGCNGGGGINAPFLAPGPTVTHLYVSDGSSTGKIYIYTLPLGPGASPTGTITSVVNHPDDMKFDASGRLFVGNGSGTAVSVLGAPVTSASSPVFTLNSSHPNARYVAFDPAGDLFVGNTTGGGGIDAFAAPVGAASPIAYSVVNHGGVNDLLAPWGIAFDASGKLYVSSGTSILMYTPPLSGSTMPTATVTPNSDNYGIAVGASNQLYVENATVNGTLDVFTTPLTNASVRNFGIAVAPASYLIDITVDSAGNLYITAGDGKVYYIPAPITAASVPTAALTFTPPTTPFGITVGP